MLKVFKKNPRRAVIVAVIFIIIATAALWAWLSFGQLTPAKERVFRILPFPAAMVSGQPITVNDYLSRYDLAQKFSGQTGQIPPADLKSIIYNGLITETEINILAQKYGVAATGPQIDEELLWQQNRARSQGQDLSAELEQLGVSQAVYKNQLLKSQVAAANLAVWFYSQKQYNQQAYATSGNITDQLKSGTKFEALAKAASQDPQSKTLGGDLGFLELDQILPEVQNTLKDTRPGDVKIAATRYGIEVIFVAGGDNNGPNNSARLHLQQIFLAGGDFNTWFGQETKNFKIIKIWK